MAFVFLWTCAAKDRALQQGMVQSVVAVMCGPWGTLGDPGAMGRSRRGPWSYAICLDGAEAPNARS